MRKLLEVMGGYVYYLIAVMISWVYADVQTHQIVYTKYMQVFVYQLYLDKVVFLKKEQVAELEKKSNIGTTTSVSRLSQGHPIQQTNALPHSKQFYTPIAILK